MQAWYLCENPYPFIPQEVLDSVESVRGNLPNRYCDPQTAAQLFEECLDEYRLCDEVGLNIISNEHHSGINCLYGASPLILGILARETRNVRILSLGTLVTARPDPVRIAETTHVPLGPLAALGLLGVVGHRAWREIAADRRASALAGPVEDRFEPA